MIDNEASLSYSNNHLMIANADGLSEEYLDDVDAVMVNSLKVKLSSYLINELSKRNIRIIFSNERFVPTTEVLSFNSTHDTCSKIKRQFYWQQERKDYLWMQIVRNKIINQAEHLQKVGKKFRLKKYLKNLELSDITNCEAFAARSYFMKLFGKDFSRKKENLINPALNYGYMILLSMVNRSVVSLGYSTKFGIHHDCATNSFNFSCDLIEPFRPIVDRIVFQNGEKELDTHYKHQLIDIACIPVIYRSKQYKLDSAITAYTTDVIKFLNEKTDKLYEVSLVY